MDRQKNYDYLLFSLSKDLKPLLYHNQYHITWNGNVECRHVGWSTKLSPPLGKGNDILLYKQSDLATWLENKPSKNIPGSLCWSTECPQGFANWIVTGMVEQVNYCDSTCSGTHGTSLCQPRLIVKRGVCVTV